MNCNYKENTHFARWYQELGSRQFRQLFKSVIIRKCSITEDIFYNWLTGRSEIPQLAKPIIEQVVGVALFNPNIESNGGN